MDLKIFEPLSGCVCCFYIKHYILYILAPLIMLEHFCGHCGTLPRAKGPYLIIMDPRMDSAWLIPGDPLSGLPNRSVFRGKGPHADLFDLRGPQKVCIAVQKSTFFWQSSGYIVKGHCLCWWFDFPSKLKHSKPTWRTLQLPGTCQLTS